MAHTKTKADTIHIQTIRRDDQTGFWLYWRGPYAVALHWWKFWSWNPKTQTGSIDKIPGFLLVVRPFVMFRSQLGFYVGYRARGRARSSRFCLGLTLNPNLVPYSFR